MVDLRQFLRPSNLTGAAGVFYAAAKLSDLGFVVAPTLRNARGIDILASNEKGKTVGIQVKASTIKNKKKGIQWILGEKDGKNYSKDLFYVLVYLDEKNEKPQYYIVPSNEVARQIETSHKKWKKTPGKNGQPHKETSMRRFFSGANERYLNKWNVLDL